MKFILSVILVCFGGDDLCAQGIDSLRLTMKDGSSVSVALSDIRKITFDSIKLAVVPKLDGNTNLSAMLSRDGGGIMVAVTADRTLPAVIEAVDLLGRTLLVQPVSLHKGSNRIRLKAPKEMTELGTYFVRVGMNGRITVTKLIYN